MKKGYYWVKFRGKWTIGFFRDESFVIRDNFQFRQILFVPPTTTKNPQIVIIK